MDYIFLLLSTVYSCITGILPILLVIRAVLQMQARVSINYIELLNKIILALGSLVGMMYLKELLMTWDVNFSYERYAFYNRALGPYWWAYWMMIICNIIAPQFFWIKSFRRNVYITFAVCIFINLGMWFERMVIIVTSMHRDYLPSSWEYYAPTVTTMLPYIGVTALLMLLLLWFIKSSRSIS